MTKRLVQGNEAVLLGAIKAGASFFAGYPISPSSEILAQASVYASKHPEFRFIQEEDEIASANAILGGSLAGAKSFTATSGPGFSLMQEAIGYGHKVGIPCVIVNIMRVGPATTPASSSIPRPSPNATSTRSTPSTLRRRAGAPSSFCPMPSWATSTKS